MPAAVLHLPLDFERIESVRLLGRKLSAIDAAQGELAPLYALRVWMDWALSGKLYRPLQNKPTGAAHDHAWSRENITFVLEDAARWKGESGALMLAMIDAGFVRAIVDPEQHDLVVLAIEGFWKWNEHFAPNYKSPHQRGADATNAAKALKKVAELASEHRKLFEAQGYLPFGAAAPSEQEQDACFSLFLRLHRECGLDLPQRAEEFPESAMRDALRVIREFTPQEIARIEQYVIEHAQDVDFVKNPARILEQFRELLAKAR